MTPAPSSAQTDRTCRDAAFEQHALPWLDDVYRFASALAPNAAEAADLVQETFVRAYRSWDDAAPTRDGRRWLLALCHATFRQSRSPRRVDDADPAAAPASWNDAERDLAVVRGALAPAIEQALPRLPEPLRSALVLVDLEAQSYEGAAEILGLDAATLRARLFRGRSMLQDLLAADVGADGRLGLGA